MHDAHAVGLGDRLAGLKDVVRSLLRRDAAAGAQKAIEVLTLEVLHDEEGIAVVEGPDVVDTHDVLAAQACGRLGLLHEPADGLGVLQRLRQEQLDRDCCSRRTCVARTTTPMPPVPSTRSTRYFAARTSPGDGVLIRKARERELVSARHKCNATA